MNACAASPKREQEKHALEAALPLLQKLYGCITINPNQCDAPDFSMCVTVPNKHWGRKCQPFEVGIEVTTIDSLEILGYFNDEKHSKKDEIAQINNYLKSGAYTARPFKRLNVNINENFLSSALLKKSEKYNRYSKSGVYREIIIICFSAFLEKRLLDDGQCNLKEWTSYILHQNSFPFDKVLFVNFLDNKFSVVAYDKKKVHSQQPAKFQTATLDISQSSFLPFGEDVNVNQVLWGKRIIEPKKTKKDD